jgi:hypothetical protein
MSIFQGWHRPTVCTVVVVVVVLLVGYHILTRVTKEG